MPPKFKRKEHDVQSAIIDFLVRACGMEAVRFNSGATLYGSGASKRFIFFYTWFGKIGAKMHKGVPDVFAFCPTTGISCWIEVKRDGKSKERPEQERFRKAVEASATFAIVASSVDEVAESVIPELQRRGKDIRWMGYHHLQDEGDGVHADSSDGASGEQGDDGTEAGERPVEVVRKGARRKKSDS